MPKNKLKGKFDSGTLINESSESLHFVYVCQPRCAHTLSPTLNILDFDSMTSPTVSPVIISPICTGGA